MSAAAKRVSHSSVNWSKLGEALTAGHNAELARLKGQNSTFSAQVNQLPADLPKVDFAALKKQMPAHANVLDSLQKQYEALKIPYGEVPAALNAEIEKWAKYNEARIKLHALKTADGAEEAKKVEQKWAKAPPVEHMDRQAFVEFFPQLFYDLRYQKRIPDPCQLGINENFHLLEYRFKDYKVLRRPDKVDDH
ncbi:ATP synthase subunit d, mitochondrial [Aphelenchoides fujianensis]|nr:ATP synthase subunit d, mitochondrial [Aphelenchoides fujianensis]